MKNTVKFILVIVICMLAVQASVFGTEETPNGKPVALVVNPAYQFETAVEESELVHDFILKNTGTAPLNIEKVRTG